MPYNACQAARIADGRCKDCGEKRGPQGTTIFCRPCASARAERSSARVRVLRAAWRASGEAKCASCCGPRPDPAFKTCASCRASKRTDWKEYGPARRQERFDAGLCVGCASARLPESKRCRAHWLADSVRKYGAPARDAEHFWALLERQRFLCHYSGAVLVPGKNASLDHRSPRARGGLSDLANAAWCDRNVNAFKRDMDEYEFVALCRSIADRFR